MTDWQIINRVPTAAEHRAIAVQVGWEHAFDWDTLDDSLAGSQLGVTALIDDLPVGMGRVVGDGVKYFYVQDLAVAPGQQRTGLGTVLLQNLLDQIAGMAPSTAFVGLFATPEGDALYRANGFSGGDMTGMFRLVESG
ncbi:GNAT family N-acetyltransferase [Microbacterium sp. NPDC057659]|uniref:GNAT family N-acetyltransferase n=1 Tax=Microbacterium sp. NPDC057659 TaxID=3346198 RepID=UPI00367122E3